MPSDSPIGDPDVDLWLAAMRAAGRRPATLKHCRWCLQQSTAWIDNAVADVAVGDAVAYSGHLTEQHGCVSAPARVWSSLCIHRCIGALVSAARATAESEHAMRGTQPGTRQPLRVDPGAGSAHNRALS